MPSVTAIIPARLASTRFPRKVLASDTGKAMVVHVCEQAAAAASVGRVVVATDADEIASVVRSVGFEAVMTSAAHDNGTSRLAEAAEALKLKKHDTIINVQGDEPEIEPGLIDAAVQALRAKLVFDRTSHFGSDSRAAFRFQWVGTVASPFREGEDASNPNIVKAVVGVIEPDSGIAPAIYFSRACVPHDRDGMGVRRLRHLGLYAYSADALLAYTRLAPTPLEVAERLEQLRWLEHGMAVAVAIRPSSHVGIDTPEQYRAFVERYRANSARS